MAPTTRWTFILTGMELYFLFGYLIHDTSHDAFLSVMLLNISASLVNYSNQMSCPEPNGQSLPQPLSAWKSGAAAPHLGR